MVDRKFGIVSQRRHRKDRNSAKGQSLSSCYSTGPPGIVESAGWNRATYRPPQNSRPWSQPNKIRCRRSDLRLSVCLVLEYESFDARFDSEGDWYHEPMLKLGVARNTSIVDSTRSFASLRTRSWREEIAATAKILFEEIVLSRLFQIAVS